MRGATNNLPGTKLFDIPFEPETNDNVVHQDNKVQSYNNLPDKKVVQDNGGWGATAGVVAADGNKFEGLKIKAE